MIFWESKYEVEEVIQFKHLGRRAWRWVIEADVKHGPCLMLAQHVLFRDSPDWRPATRYYSIWLNKRFALGMEHIYYDGPHCSFSLGWLHFAWAPASCSKCEDFS